MVLVAEVRVDDGPYSIVAQMVVMPRGITVTAVSPNYAHLGATAQAIPRPETGGTATVSLLCVPCHRDEIPAHDIAAALATRFRVPCAASVGLHVERATENDLRLMMGSVRTLSDRLVDCGERAFREMGQR